MKKRLIEIDILRTFSIILILLHHLDAYTYCDLFLIFKPYFGVFGISLFVFLSGYSLNINNNIFKNFSDFLKFYRKRIERIYPLYILAIIVFFVLYQVIGQVMAKNFQWWLIQILGLEVLLSPRFIDPIFTLWFIGMLILYYFIYPFILYRSTDVKEIFFKSLLIFSSLIFIRIIWNIIDIRFFLYYFLFITGILTSRINLFYDKKYNNIFFISLISFLFFLIIHLHAGSYSIYEGPNTLGELNNIDINKAIGILFILELLMITFVILITYLVTVYSSNLEDESNRVTVKFSIFGAFASYGVYLLHRPYLTIFYYSMRIFNFSPILSDLVIYIIALPSLFIFSYYLQKFNDLLFSKSLKII